MSKIYYFFSSIIFLLLFSQQNFSQTDFYFQNKLDSLPYLGQTPPDTVPELFGPGFISSTSDAEYSICFSQDGKEIYFSRNTVGVSNTIWWTHFENSAWTTPVMAPFTGSYYNSEAFITYDNQKMYFISARDTSTNFQIYFMSRSGSNWTTPQKLGTPFSLDRIKMFPTLASNGNIYFTQFSPTMKGDFYMAKNINGFFQTPMILSTTLNAFYDQGHFFIAPDESYAVFDVIPTQQSTGSMIYASFKKADSTWGNPIKLSNTINSTNNQHCPYISPDGKYLFFTKGGDLWWVDSKVVTRHKPVGIIKICNTIPEECSLLQNYPNPFNPNTVIRFRIKDSRFVSLKIYNILGQQIATLVNEKLKTGIYEVPFNINLSSGIPLPTGIYFYKLNAGDFSETKKMLIKK
jgi:hypothetical protein